jgi:hypothetical protein
MDLRRAGLAVIAFTCAAGVISASAAPSGTHMRPARSGKGMDRTYVQ